MLNQCNFIGNLFADPELKNTTTGKSVCSFRIGVNEKRGGEDHTESVSIVCWEKTAEYVGKYLRKGSKVFVSGKMQTRPWTDKDGNKRYTTEIVASTVQNLSHRSEGRQEQPPEPSEPLGGDDSVPF